LLLKLVCEALLLPEIFLSVCELLIAYDQQQYRRNDNNNNNIHSLSLHFHQIQTEPFMIFILSSS
jgi:hypothetical protein